MSSKSRFIAETSVLAATYAALVWLLQPISFREVQFRVADMLVGLVPVLGWSGIWGITLGVLIGNLASPLGPIDLISAIPTFVGAWLIWKLREKSVFLGLTLYSAVVSAWVGYALWITFNVPLLLGTVYVFIGVEAASGVGGYIVYRLVKEKLVEIVGNR